VLCISTVKVVNDMISQQLEIINKLGLHARASTKFTQTASKFSSEIWIEANGEDEALALAALSALIADYFGEGE